MGAIKSYLSSKFQVGLLWAAAMCPLPNNFWHGEVYMLPSEPIENRVNLALEINPKGLDFKRRELLAAILASSEHTSDKLNLELYINLAETRSSQDFFKQEENKSWFEKRSKSQKLKRANILTGQNRNKLVLETLENYKNPNCEVNYLTGLAYRRLRKYSEAKKDLKQVINKCDGKYKREALFLNARISAMSSSEEAVKTLDHFVKSYPSISYTDDVLLWKSHVLLDMGEIKRANKTLDDLIENYPKGDMHENSLFERAFAAIKLGDREYALRLLDNLDTPEGRYWRGRLRVYPNLENLEPNQNSKERLLGLEKLKELALNVPNNYFGYLAAELSKTKIYKKRQKFIYPMAAKLKQDSIYQSMLCLKKKNKLKEAAWILDRLSREYKGLSDREILAKQYIEVGRADQAHQLMRKTGMAFPKDYNNSDSNSDFPWDLSFSKPYLANYRKFAQRNKMPWAWLIGLSREESAFDSEVVSWAGAVGLCQLLPSTAKLSLTKLQDPVKNIRAGAEHIKELRQKLDHPLKAIAAYNAGRGAVNRWDRELREEFKVNVPIDYFVERIPYSQTRAYVKKVSSAWLTYAWLSGDLKPGLFSINNGS